MNNDIHFVIKLGNLSGRSGDKKTRSRGTLFKVEKIEEDSIPSPSAKIQIIGGKVYLR